MTEDHKLLKFTSRGKLLTTVALCGTLLLSNGPANAAPSTSSETPKTMEQMQPPMRGAASFLYFSFPSENSDINSNVQT